MPQAARLAAQTHNSPRALLPMTSHHHTSKVRPEADIIALQQFVHNLFHHRNIPSGWAERQKKRVLVIPCAGRGPGQTALLQRPSCPTAPVCATDTLTAGTASLFPFSLVFAAPVTGLGPRPAHKCHRAARAPKPSWGWDGSLSRYFGSFSAVHPDSWVPQPPSAPHSHLVCACIPAVPPGWRTLQRGHHSLHTLSTLSLATNLHIWGASLCPAHRWVHTHTQRQKLSFLFHQVLHGVAAASLLHGSLPFPCHAGHLLLVSHRTARTSCALRSPLHKFPPSRHPALSHTPVQPLLLCAPRYFFILLK